MGQRKTSFGRMVGLLVASLAAGLLAASSALAADPLKIGFSMAQSGPLAGSGKSALLAMRIWAEDQNAKGGCSAGPCSSSIMTTRVIPRMCRRSTLSFSMSTKSI